MTGHLCDSEAERAGDGTVSPTFIPCELFHCQGSFRWPQAGTRFSQHPSPEAPAMLAGLSIKPEHRAKSPLALVRLSPLMKLTSGRLDVSVAIKGKRRVQDVATGVFSRGVRRLNSADTDMVAASIVRTRDVTPGSGPGRQLGSGARGQLGTGGGELAGRRSRRRTPPMRPSCAGGTLALGFPTGPGSSPHLGR